jgi:Major capsid protein 13-like
MATVQIVDIYNPLVFDAAVDEAAIEQNRLLAAGVLVSNPMVDDMASVGGQIGEMPFFGPLGTEEPEYVDDDPAHLGTPAKIASKKMIYRLAKMHKAWSTMDVARELALRDPLAAITSKIGGYWATQMQKRVVQSAMGVLADNVANDAGDMIKDIATDDAGAVTDAERISAEAVLDAAQTMGDAKEKLAAIAMHSVCYTKLQKQNLIDYVPTSDSKVNIPYYLGKLVIVDDSLPAVAGVNRVTYTTILYAQGAFEMGNGRVLKPSEPERLPNAGYGGGQDIIHTRKSVIIHPVGTAFLSANVAGVSATLAELALAANWNRVMARKNLGIAFLQTNG